MHTNAQDPFAYDVEDALVEAWHGESAGGNAAAAGRIVNAIPRVCAAPPGLLTARDLPLIPGLGMIAR